jgi:ubiquinone/menaquinone biosynthesis C-methylase UbiE
MKVDLACASADLLGFGANSFDVVVSTLAFHHLPLPTKEAAVCEIARVLRPGGAFFLVDLVPRRGRMLSREEANRPERCFVTNTRDTLRQLLSGAGFQVSDQAAPRAWALAPWLFAVRGAMRRTQQDAE